MKKKPSSLARALPALLLCLLCLVPTAYADMGPKPEVTITVVNAPEGTLYLDLLTEETPTEHPYSNLDNYDPAILESLRSLEGDGWVLAYSTGVSGPPVFGDLRPREDGTWHFSYHGVPVAFRVAAATADEARAVEEIYTRPFVCHIVYDWEANTVQEATPPLLRFFVRLASTLLPTLVIEGVIFWLFGFQKMKSWIVFLIVNIATQIGLHLAAGCRFPCPAGIFSTTSSLPYSRSLSSGQSRRPPTPVSCRSAPAGGGWGTLSLPTSPVSRWVTFPSTCSTVF